MRVIGDPGTVVRRIGLLPGTTSIQAALKMLPDVDVIVAGEVREWETVEYVRDKVYAGEKKGLVLVGRVVSEEPGMQVCQLAQKRLPQRCGQYVLTLESNGFKKFSSGRFTLTVQHRWIAPRHPRTSDMLSHARDR